MSTTEERVTAPAPTETGVGGAAPAATARRAAPDRVIPPPPPGRQGRRLVRMAVWGASPLDRRNRTILGLVGLVVGAAGVGTLLLYGKTISTSSPHTIYTRWVRDARGAEDLSAAIACAICLVIFLLAAGWALAQLRPVGDGERVNSIRLSKGERGRTTLAATTLAKAAGTDLSQRPGISSARVRIRAATPTARIQATVELDLDADVDAALVEVSDAVAQLVGALGQKVEDADTEVRLRFGRSERAPKVAGAPRVG